MIEKINSPLVIAYYLPQFHPTPNNDKWWGKGFTEWTNVAKARRLFRNHYQPHIPADLGFYDLRLPEVREQQAEMARYSGISAFCYYHYWFEDGKEELDRPFKEVLKLGRPDFPFCLCWANESWYSKMWSSDGAVVSKKLLVEQKYLGEEDNKKHFNSLLPAFKDNRYFRYNGKIVFVIYRPLSFEGMSDLIKQWRAWADQAGIGDFYFIGYSYDVCREYNKIIELGFDAVNSCGIINYKLTNCFFKKVCNRLNSDIRKLTKRPDIHQYKEVLKYFINKDFDLKENVLPSLIPNWDHTPRSGVNGYLFDNSTPELFSVHLNQVKEVLNRKSNKLCFLKSWNEWGEGNYVEPDMKFGWGYLDALKAFTESKLSNSEIAL